MKGSKVSRDKEELNGNKGVLEELVTRKVKGSKGRSRDKDKGE